MSLALSKTEIVVLTTKCIQTIILLRVLDLEVEMKPEVFKSDDRLRNERADSTHQCESCQGICFFWWTYGEIQRPVLIQALDAHFFGQFRPPVKAEVLGSCSQQELLQKSVVARPTASSGLVPSESLRLITRYQNLPLWLKPVSFPYIS